MNGRGYTVLPKVEWDRLKKQAGEMEKPDEVKHREDRDEYLRALNEKSQKWIDTWPDSLQGVVDKVAKHKERRHERNMKMINEYKALQELKKLEKFDNIAKAKQRIFDASGYVPEGVYQPPPYHPYKRCNYLEQALGRRQQDPSPWNGREASHEYFAQQAGDVLAQCKYKHFAKKVVDDYRRVNGLNKTTLPVEKY